MSNNMDKDVFNMDEINKLMDDLFDADTDTADMVKVVSKELDKMDSRNSLEQFKKDEAERYDKFQNWLKNDRTGRAPQASYQSNFGGVEKHNLNQLNNQTITGPDAVVFEKDDLNSSLAGVKNVTGIEDIHDFFAVGRDTVGKSGIDINTIDEQMKEIINLPESEKRELDQEFVEDILGMNIQRLREVSGATSAWKEITAIKCDLEEIERNTKKVKYRFEQFIDLYVKDKIPK